MRHKTISAAVRSLRFLLETAIEETLDESAETSSKEFKEVVSEWKHKPSFAYRKGFIYNGSQRIVFRSGNAEVVSIFGWVDEGTEPHVIKPKTPTGRLTYRTGYNPRSAYRGRYGVGDGKSSGDWVSSKGVNHPGTEAREFTETIAETTLERMETILISKIRRLS